MYGHYISVNSWFKLKEVAGNSHSLHKSLFCWVQCWQFLRTGWLLCSVVAAGWATVQPAWPGPCCLVAAGRNLFLLGQHLAPLPPYFSITQAVEEKSLPTVPDLQARLKTKTQPSESGAINPLRPGLA